MIGATPVLYLGTFLPTACGFTRIAADHLQDETWGLAQCQIACTITSVVAAFPQWAETYRLNRYPSPDGRPYALLQRPPFFTCESKPYADRRGCAQIARRRRTGFDSAVELALSERNSDQETRGDIRCSSVNPFLYSCAFQFSWRPAATPCLNRRCSAGPRAPARRPSWEDRCLPGRRWGPRATWRSAKSTRTNACSLNFAPVTGRLNLHETTPRASGAVVFSYHPRPAGSPGRARLKGT